MFNSTHVSGGCLVGVLRRLLSSSFHRSHSHHITDETTSSDDSDRHVQSPAPNLVARLMGLDSMPKLTSIHPNSTQIDQQQKVDNDNSFSIPTFIDQENDDYLVLSFENVDLDQTKAEKRPRRVKRSRRKKKKKRSNQETIENSETASPVALARLKPRKSQKKLKVESECSSEDSSPVSVLDFGPEDGSRSADSNSRRRLAPKLEEHEQRCASNEQEGDMDRWGFEDSNWSYRRNCSFGEVGDVCKDVEVQLLDQLFHELVLHLTQITSTM